MLIRTVFYAMIPGNGSLQLLCRDMVTGVNLLFDYKCIYSALHLGLDSLTEVLYGHYVNVLQIFYTTTSAIIINLNGEWMDFSSCYAPLSGEVPRCTKKSNKETKKLLKM